MAFIFYGSAQPSLPSLPDTLFDLIMKKSAHVAEYAVLAILWYRALYTRLPSPSVQWLAFIIAFLYALSDEFHQSFIPGRTASWRDVALDVGGAALGLLLWNMVIYFRRNAAGSRSGLKEPTSQCRTD